VLGHHGASALMFQVSQEYVFAEKQERCVSSETSNQRWIFKDTGATVVHRLPTQRRSKI
jgi:ribosomal silencing factor RsfS